MPALLLSLAIATVATGPGGAVATAHPLATAAAVEVLREGGNAADAAVAAAFALSVVEPQSSGLGGGGFALVWSERERKATVLDFREVAPAAASADLFTRPDVPLRASLDGGLAVAVPGAAKGYAELARRFGTRPLSRLVEPAAQLAENGFRLGPAFVDRATERLGCLRSDEASARELLLPSEKPPRNPKLLPRKGEDGGPTVPPVGATLVRRELAQTLRLLGKEPEAFYRGSLARRIAEAVRARGGVLTEGDLYRYRVRELTPLEGRYRGRRILTMPPPSAGGAIVLGLLGALEPEEPRAGGYRPERFLHVMIEAMKRLYARRAVRLGDPAQVRGARAAAEEMASPAFAEKLRASIGERATPAGEIDGTLPGEPGPARPAGPAAGEGEASPAAGATGQGEASSPATGAEKGETSHVSVIDAQGNAVVLTTTVNYYFGACVTVPGTGLLLNDEMDDFDRAPGEENAYGLVGRGPNAVAPGKVPLSSMAPTLVFDPFGRLVLAVGAAGGARIPTAVAQAIIHVVDDGMQLDEALGAPRLHHQHLPDVTQVEENGLEAATAQALEARGHHLSFARSRWPNAQAVGVAASGLFEAAANPRYEGRAGAP